MNAQFEQYLLKLTQASSCIEIEYIQSLWSGYGKISRYQFFGSRFKTLVVKQISLKKIKAHPKGWNTDISHFRKVKSYEVETFWYQNWNSHLNQQSKTPNFIGAYSFGESHWIVLEDLDTQFPVRKTNIGISELKVCLKWLANFHATFINKEAAELWEIGTYWHLATRPDEFKKISNERLKSKAALIDKKLNTCVFKTIVHGDAKLANFCFSESGKHVAAVDFQYVGAGCGMKDVAYLLGSCLSSDECVNYEDELLDYYFGELMNALPINISFEDLEQEWRQLYPYAIADFTRFLLGWLPTHQKLNSYHLDIMNKVLDDLS